MATYSAKRSLIEGPSEYELSDGQLVRHEHGAAKQHLALAEVRRVRITFSGGGGVSFWMCSVETPKERIWFPSVTWEGIGKVQNQGADFRAFIQDLGAAIPAQTGGKPVAFVRGGSWMRPVFFGFLVLFAILGVLLAMGIAGSMMSNGGFGWAITPSLVIMFAAGMSWRMWRSNAPGVIDPAALPADIAPGG